MSKIISVKDAVSLIRDGYVVATIGAGLIGYPETVVSALERNYLETGKPRDLTVIAATGHGYHGEKGDNHFAHEGLIKKTVIGHLRPVGKIAKMINNNQIEGYSIPQGYLHIY
jgi:propionate CoA-transferase